MTDKVILRRWIDDGSVFALFPDIPADYAGLLCTCYQHVGQHGSADLKHCLTKSDPADLKDDEVKALVAELEGVPFGYRLEVVEP
jgi:hypothetical protein